MLAEAIVATGILMTALVALAQLFALSVAANAAAKDTTMASVLAEQRVEEIRAMPRVMAEESAGGVDYLDRHGLLVASGEEPPGGAIYARRWTVTPLASQPDDAFVVDVVVTRVGDRNRRSVGGRPPATARVIDLIARHGE